MQLSNPNSLAPTNGHFRLRNKCWQIRIFSESAKGGKGGRKCKPNGRQHRQRLFVSSKTAPLWNALYFFANSVSRRIFCPPSHGFDLVLAQIFSFRQQCFSNDSTKGFNHFYSNKWCSIESIVFYVFSICCRFEYA